ncbi:hypothetical protein ACFCZ3_20160 [Cellulosimicrobium cellulans]|uniref:hypothetical protein n=1 Tax=Cellulosimicrobium cellulans TaxID=1710 RepID=UPI0035D628B0
MTTHPAPPREDPAAMPLPPTIVVPTPHVPTGPKGVPLRESDPAYLDSAAWNLEHGYKVGGSGVTAMVVRLLRHAAHAVRTAPEPAPAFRPLDVGAIVAAMDLPPELVAVVEERRRSPHQCEAWQMEESAKGGVYCGACGDGYRDGFPGPRDAPGDPVVVTLRERVDFLAREVERLAMERQAESVRADAAEAERDRLAAALGDAPAAEPARSDHPVSATGHRWPCTRYYVTASGRETCTCDAAARGVSS